MQNNPPKNTLEPDNSQQQLGMLKKFYGFYTTWDLHFWLNLGVNVRAFTQTFELRDQPIHLQNAHTCTIAVSKSQELSGSSMFWILFLYTKALLFGVSYKCSGFRTKSVRELEQPTISLPDKRYRIHFFYAVIALQNGTARQRQAKRNAPFFWAVSPIRSRGEKCKLSSFLLRKLPRRLSTSFAELERIISSDTPSIYIYDTISQRDDLCFLIGTSTSALDVGFSCSSPLILRSHLRDVRADVLCLHTATKLEEM